MHPILRALRLLIPLLGMMPIFPSVHAQGFSSGSDGRDGDLIVVNTTRAIPLPPDGILRYRSVNIGASALVTFVPNALNTPVYLLVQGGFTNAGLIRVSGQNATATAGGAGGPGGFAGGAPALFGQPGGRGHGPGGGAAATATAVAGKGAFASEFSSRTANDGALYGSEVLMPLIGGSGGGGSNNRGGGGGGGAILIASSQQIVFVSSGRIQAAGGNGAAGGAGPGSGSGGAVRLVAPRIDNLGGSVRTVDVGELVASLSGGRLRIDATDYTGIRASILPPAPVTSLGNLMATFPPPAVTPSLDITRVGPTPVAGGTRVDVTLAAGLPQSQPILVHARNLDRATLALAVIPDSGAASFVRVPIAGTDVDVTVNATFPPNRSVSVEAWSE